MNKLKDKFESYTVSSIEESQRAILLDDLASSVELVENDAEKIMKESGVKSINDQECVNELCRCLLSVLSHELKVIHVAEKPSFWFVAERISPKDTVKMIYRLDIRQSDSARCQVWIRHALIEGTIGSYFALLEEDTKIVKQCYKPSAFVRDIQKMEAAKNLISNIIASVQFDIKLEGMSYIDNQSNYAKRRGSASSTDTFMKRQNKGKGSPSNVAIIQDLSSSYSTNMGVSPKLSDTISLPGDFSASNRFDRSFELPDQINEYYLKAECSSGNMSSQYLDSPVNDYFKSDDKDEGSPKLVHKPIQKKHSSDVTADSEHTEISDSSENSLSSSVDSLMAGCITKNNVIVNMIRVVSDDASPKKSEDTLNVFVKDSFYGVDNGLLYTAQSSDVKSDIKNEASVKEEHSVSYEESRYISGNKNSNEIDDRTLEQNDSFDHSFVASTPPPSEHIISLDSGSIQRQISEKTENRTISTDKYLLDGLTKKKDIEQLPSLPTNVNVHSAHELINIDNDDDLQFPDIADNSSAINSNIKGDICGNDENENHNDEQIPSKNPITRCSGDQELSSESSHPSLNVCGSLTLSQNSAFDVVEKIGEGSNVDNIMHVENDGIDCDADEGNLSQTQVGQIINVINEHERMSDGQNSIEQNEPLSDSLNTEEEYRNQVHEYQKSVSLEGSSQLSNVLNNVSVPVSSHGDYFVPGIHSSSDVDGCEYTLHDTDNSTIEVSTSISIPSVGSAPKNIPIKDYSLSSPSTISTISAKLFEKTLFSKTLGSSFGSKGSNDGNVYSDSESECSAGQSFSMLIDLGVSDDFIGMKEDHFSTPDTFMGFSSLEELENAIASCKQLINSAPEKSKRRDELVTHLVQLRLKLHELKDSEPSPKDGKKVLGHQFFKQGSMSSTLECDACAATIFPLLQKVYVCKDCGFHCHGKCLNILEKPCVHSKKLTSVTCELRICPEIPLSAQQYRCADCFKRIPMYDGQFEVRLCDYTGQKYCAKCHWNDTCVIPARVVHNWDFSLYKVSRQSKHLLMLLSKKPDIKLQSINAVLFNFVDELRDVRTLRQQIMMMKKYIVSCRVATEDRLLLLLQNRQHFVDNSDVYSLQDLLDVHNNVLLNELSRIHSTYGKHIKFDCLLCQGKGFICEFCNAEEIIFPFDNHVTGCICKGTFHRLCYSQNNCPKCLRNERKKSTGVV